MDRYFASVCQLQAGARGVRGSFHCRLMGGFAVQIASPGAVGRGTCCRAVLFGPHEFWVLTCGGKALLACARVYHVAFIRAACRS